VGALDRRLPPRPLRLAGVALLAGLGVACGPSFQAVYEGDVRFEHCYALDQRPVGEAARKECWRDWLFGYTYGQSRDRVEYAAARYSELSLDRTLPSEDTASARPPRASGPIPTSAFAPLPNLAEHALVDPPVEVKPAPVVAAVVRAPGEECAMGCGATWKACHEVCKAPGCEGCDRVYRQCVPRCMQGVAGRK
jgi:hypothetical protein